MRAIISHLPLWPKTFPRMLPTLTLNASRTSKNPAATLKIIFVPNSLPVSLCVPPNTFSHTPEFLTIYNPNSHSTANSDVSNDSPKCLSLYYQNVRGLRTKTRNVYLNSLKLPYDIFALTETNLTPNFHDNEVFPEAVFNTFRADGLELVDCPSGRGVLLAVNVSFDAHLFKKSQTNDFEFVCVKITFPRRCLYILCCYIHPSQPITTYQLATDAVDSLFDAIDPCDDVITLGDFNLPNLQWTLSDDESHFVPNATSDKELLLTDRLCDSGLLQVSGIRNYLDRQLDLVFSSDADNSTVSESNHLLSTLDSFHPPLFLTFSYENTCITPASEHSYYFNFRKADFDKLNNLLTYISPISTSLPIEHALAKFNAEIFACFIQSVPYVPHKNCLSSPPWYNKELRTLRNKRNKQWKLYLNSKSESDLANYIRTYTQFSDLCETLYLEYLRRVQLNLISDPKHFFQFINSKRKSDGYPSTLRLSNTSSSDPKTIANLFAEFFRQSFADHALEPDTDYFRFMDNLTQTSLVSVDITPSAVATKINNLKDDFSPGPDGLPAIVLKKCINHLTQPLSALFQLSIAQGIFPELWKHSYITPIHKKGCKSEISNYRPIAKLSCVPKLFESIVYDVMFFHCKQIFSSKQHGFLKGRSTVTNLTEFVSRTLCTLEDGDEIDVVATDFSKAFDKIPHQIILFKLKALGFQPRFISWIKSYLVNRQYKVRFRSSLSDPITATSGVPQGSHLGPLIFILSINDAETVIKASDLSVYADDMKIFRRISSPADSYLLQEDLNRFFVWCQKNFLELNVTKCHSITYSRKRLPPPPRDYFINNELVPLITSARDLGVICDRELNFRSHIDNIIRRANSALGFIKRWSKEFSDPYVTKALYTTFVRPLLEYASQVWSPHHLVHSTRIEAVQRRFLRFALRGLPWTDTHNLPPYVDRLKLINLQSLESRRDTADILFVHQLVAGYIDCPALLEMISLNTNPRNLRSVPLFRLASHRTNYGHYEPMARMLRKANNAVSLFDFNISKNALRAALLNSTFSF